MYGGLLVNIQVQFAAVENGPRVLVVTCFGHQEDLSAYALGQFLVHAVEMVGHL
jgi:hypothetical protein